MDIKLTLVERIISRNRFLILRKVNETSEVPAHSSAAYAASVGENYVLDELPTQDTVDRLAHEQMHEPYETASGGERSLASRVNW